MAELLIRDEQIAHKLLSLSTRESRSVEALLDDMIRDYETRPSETGNPLLKMAESAKVLGLHADRDDISEHFDELLRDSFGKQDKNP